MKDGASEWWKNSLQSKILKPETKREENTRWASMLNDWAIKQHVKWQLWRRRYKWWLPQHIALILLFCMGYSSKQHLSICILNGRPKIGPREDVDYNATIWPLLLLDAITRSCCCWDTTLVWTWTIVPCFPTITTTKRDFSFIWLGIERFVFRRYSFIEPHTRRLRGRK